MKYYYFISGLEDVKLEDSKLPKTLFGLKQELEDVLSEEDYQLMKMIFLQYDNQNLLAVLENKQNPVLNELGMFSLQDLMEFIQQIKEDENVNNDKIPAYFRLFIPDYLSGNKQEGISWENQLSSLYYDYAIKSNNKFLSNWFEFNLNVNNILSAIICRKFGFNIQNSIIGNNEIAENIRTTNSRDFGLTKVFYYWNDLLSLLDEPNMLEREKKIDELRWQYLEENSFFHYFQIENILVYLLKTQIISRWKSLNKESGSLVLREMISVMKQSVKLN